MNGRTHTHVHICVAMAARPSPKEAVDHFLKYARAVKAGEKGKKTILKLYALGPRLAIKYPEYKKPIAHALMELMHDERKDDLQPSTRLDAFHQVQGMYLLAEIDYFCKLVTPKLTGKAEIFETATMGKGVRTMKDVEKGEVVALYGVDAFSATIAATNSLMAVHRAPVAAADIPMLTRDGWIYTIHTHTLSGRMTGWGPFVMDQVWSIVNVSDPNVSKQGRGGKGCIAQFTNDGAIDVDRDLGHLKAGVLPSQEEVTAFTTLYHNNDMKLNNSVSYTLCSYSEFFLLLLFDICVSTPFLILSTVLHHTR